MVPMSAKIPANAFVPGPLIVLPVAVTFIDPSPSPERMSMPAKLWPLIELFATMAFTVWLPVL